MVHRLAQKGSTVQCWARFWRRRRHQMVFVWFLETWWTRGFRLMLLRAKFNRRRERFRYCTYLTAALPNFSIELTSSRSFRRTHISVMMGKSSKIISKIVSCCASTTNQLRSNANSIHAIHKTFTCTKARCICYGHGARKSSHFPWTTK